MRGSQILHIMIVYNQYQSTDNQVYIPKTAISNIADHLLVTLTRGCINISPALTQNDDVGAETALTFT